MHVQSDETSEVFLKHTVGARPQISPSKRCRRGRWWWSKLRRRRWPSCTRAQQGALVGGQSLRGTERLNRPNDLVIDRAGAVYTSPILARARRNWPKPAPCRRAWCPSRLRSQRSDPTVCLMVGDGCGSEIDGGSWGVPTVSSRAPNEKACCTLPRSTGGTRLAYDVAGGQVAPAT